jgi:nitrogen fixation NifU-like protein
MLQGLDDLYQEIILDHHRNPRNQGLVEPADLSAKGFNPFCGDQVVLTAGLDHSGHLAHVGMEGQGCAISQASASIMGELIKGKSLEEAEALVELFKQVMVGHELTVDEADQLGELAALEGVRNFPVRIKCALLGWSTLQDAIREFQKSSD